LSEITVTLKNGKKRNYNRGTTLLEILKTKEINNSNNVIAGVINGKTVDLSTGLENDADLDFLTCGNPEGLQVFWHSASHVMAQAVQALFPKAILGIGPSISSGFYYDFKTDETIRPEDFPRIEAKIQKVIDQDIPFRRKVLDRDEAIALFEKRGEPFKVELIKDLPPEEEVSIYEHGDFLDLCRGPHVPSTPYLRYFKLLSVAGSYWHGDERNAVMQRIYGVAYPDKKQLKEHLRILEEAKKRDHRKLGKELDLFSFQPEGPGFVFWHPNGMVIYNAVTGYVRETLSKHGYQEIGTPLILNEELWHRSGHWDNYKDNMYFINIDDAAYAVKPMNCPGGLLVYKNKLHSYRDLPLKLSELGLVHRHEKSGVLHGLFRVRQFTQDDAHVYCTPDQLENEIINIINLVEEVYNAFGYKDYSIELSTKPQKAIGDDQIWEMAEKSLQNALEKKNIKYEINPGEGAFYGPKIDYHIKDSLGRIWQCGTIQVDFSMPERFNLEYVGPDGEKHRPVMIHRAILGSVERFIGIFIEHVGGAFPLWLAPVQCAVIPISEKHHVHAKKLYNTLKEKGIRCVLDDRSEKMGYKIREGEKQKFPYMIIMGDKEIEENTVAVRKRREGNLGTQPFETFVDKILDEINRRTND